MKFSTALENGEKLYPTTSTEGREVIRQELRYLREQWETYCDGLSDSQRRLEMALSQWASFDDSLGGLVKWISEAEQSLSTDLELKNTLQEKKAMLQNYRVYLSCFSCVHNSWSGGLNI